MGLRERPESLSQDAVASIRAGSIGIAIRKAAVAAEDWEGPRFQTCMNAALFAGHLKRTGSRTRLDA